jgi:hypothetical protein
MTQRSGGSSRVRCSRGRHLREVATRASVVDVSRSLLRDGGDDGSVVAPDRLLALGRLVADGGDVRSFPEFRTRGRPGA